MGPLFIGHGAQKLFGAFGGHGLEGTAGFFENVVGLRPGMRHARLAGAAEVAAGAMLTVGALTPVASTLISSMMVTAIRKVHGQNGPWAVENGWELNAIIIAGATAVADSGPGPLSVDSALAPRFKGPLVAAATLAAAVAGSYLATGPLNEAAPDPAPGDVELGSVDDGAGSDADQGVVAPGAGTA
jgi:putative oxidoreductase